MRTPPRAETYTVPAGTACHVRRAGEKAWRPHTTARDLTCVGHSWRNETHHGFAVGEFEVKVAAGKFRVAANNDSGGE